MFKWIKEILSYGSGRGYEEGSTILPELDTSLFAPMPKVKPCKGSDISEPVISFIECVRKNPKRFSVYHDSFVTYHFMLTKESDHSFYAIRDNNLDRAWFIKGDRYFDNREVAAFKYIRGYEEASFLTSEEKEYLIQEISSIMNYRIERKAKLDKICADRRIRDIRNKLKDLYYVD